MFRKDVLGNYPYFYVKFRFHFGSFFYRFEAAVFLFYYPCGGIQFSSFEYFLGAAILYLKLRLLCLNLGSQLYSTTSNLDGAFWVSMLQNTFSEAIKPMMTREVHFVGSDIAIVWSRKIS
jgi:hypothetical protein